MFYRSERRRHLAVAAEAAPDSRSTGLPKQKEPKRSAPPETKQIQDGGKDPDLHRS